MEKKYEFNTSFYSELSNAKNILSDITNFLCTYFEDISDESKSELKLIFSELVCNAVIHGNKNNLKKLVYISININKNTITSSIRDEGDGFDYLSVLENHKNNTNDLYYENGRGIWLVYSLSDSLTFNLKGNEIKFSKKVGF